MILNDHQAKNEKVFEISYKTFSQSLQSNLKRINLIKINNKKTFLAPERLKNKSSQKNRKNLFILMNYLDHVHDQGDKE